MMITPRSVWEDPAYRVVGPPAQLGIVSALTFHYPGIAVGEIVTHDAKVAHLRKAQRSYTTQRGYSYGYNWVIFIDGSTWEVRGDRIVCGANGSISWNDCSFAAQFVVPAIPSDVTPQQIESARWLTEHVRSLTNRPAIAQWGHRDVRSQVWPAVAAPGRWTTSCPGDVIYGRLGRGDFRPIPTPPPPPPVIVPEEDPVQVRYRDRRYLNIWLVGAAPALNMSGELDAYYSSRGVALIEGQHDQMLSGLLMQSGLSRADLVPA